MDEELTRRVRVLEAANVAAMTHSDRGLLDHLLGTRDLLLRWGARPALCDAGLFHSVYGTEQYQTATIPVALRGEVAAVIGPEAEELAWLFCIMRRESLAQNLGRREGLRIQHRLTADWLPLTQEQFDDLVTLSIANAVEMAPRLPESWRTACRANLWPLRGVALAPARQALEVALGTWQEFWK